MNQYPEISEITKYFKIVFQEYIKSNINIFEYILIFNSYLYNFKINIDKPLQSNIGFNTIDKSINKYASYTIENYIKKAVLLKSPLQLNIPFEFDSNNIYNIIITISLIPHDQIFIYHSNKLNNNPKYLLYRTLQIIKNAGDKGVTKSQFYNKTRRFLNHAARENILLELLTGNKIKIELIGNARKQQQVYYANF
jgi:hypothetical protein